MRDFLALTLKGQRPDAVEGSNAHFRWRWWDEGILELTPHREARMALALTAGVHGNETAPVEIVNALLLHLEAGQVPLLPRLLVICGNPAALRLNRRYLDADMNRMFGGKWREYGNCTEAQRAARLEQALAAFWQDDDVLRWHLDMHTALRGSLHPRFGVLPLRQSPWPDAFLAWLSAAGLEALVFHQEPGGTFTHFSSERYRAASCTLELGRALPFGDNDLSQFSAVSLALRAVICGDALPAGASMQCYRVSQQLTRRSEQFRLHMSDDTLNFTPFGQGQLLAEEGDVRHYVQSTQERVLFPNPSVAVGQRAGLMLVADDPWIPL